MIRKRRMTIETLVALFMAVVLGSCFRSRAPIRAQLPLPPGDSIVLIAVTPAVGPYLQQSKPTELLVRLEYTLNSHEKAFLSLSLDESSNPESCVPEAGYSIRTIELRSRQGVRTPISRGTHFVDIPVAWPVDAQSGPSNSIIQEGAITFHSSMWFDQLNYKFLTTSFGTQYCQRFTK